MTIEERVERLEAMVFASRVWDTERVKALMARRGWGTVELSRRLGTSAMTVSRWMMTGPNARRPGFRMWERLTALEADRG